MKEGWVLIFKTRETFKAKIAEDKLKQQGIESHILNKPDSAIPSIGNAELYCPSEKAEEAVQILKKEEILE